MTKKGLGKGLDALFADNAADLGHDAPVTLRLTEIEPNRDQPRKQFDEEALAALSDSIREHGVLQPLVVRPLPGADVYQLVAGERRWRAARMAGLSEVPVVIRELSDAQTMEIALIENLQREDLNPIEEAEGYKTLMESFGLTQEIVAKRVGKSRPVVANALRLLNLPEEVRVMVRRGELSSGHARALLASGDEKRIRTAATEILRRGLTVRDVEKLMKQPEQPPEKAVAKKQTDVVAFEIERALSEKLGRRVTVQRTRGGGELRMEFYTEEDLQALARALAGE